MLASRSALGTSLLGVNPSQTQCPKHIVQRLVIRVGRRSLVLPSAQAWCGQRTRPKWSGRKGRCKKLAKFCLRSFPNAILRAVDLIETTNFETYLSKPGSALAISSGVVLGSNRSVTSPCLETRNLVKFQAMSPGLAVFSQSYSGLAFGPLTSILANMGKVAWYRFVANSRISALLPGS